MKTAYDRGGMGAVLDRCENVPFAAVGGLDNRLNMTAPASRVKPEDADEFIRGYRDACEDIWGPGWETAAFGWHPTLILTPGPDNA